MAELGLGQFRTWLRHTVGSLKAAEPDILSAIKNLGSPIATTNYDSLLKAATGRDVVTWQDPDRIRNGDEMNLE